MLLLLIVGSSIGVINAPPMENVGVINASLSKMFDRHFSTIAIAAKAIIPIHVFTQRRGGSGDYFLLMQNLNPN